MLWTTNATTEKEASKLAKAEAKRAGFDVVKVERIRLVGRVDGATNEYSVTLTIK